METAVTYNDISVLKELIAHGGSPIGNGPFYQSMIHDNLEKAILLLEIGLALTHGTTRHTAITADPQDRFL
jgi:hypothetical protein